MLAQGKPLKVAGWALLTAFVLSVATALSDPHAARLVLLAESGGTGQISPPSAVSVETEETQFATVRQRSTAPRVTGPQDSPGESPSGSAPSELATLPDDALEPEPHLADLPELAPPMLPVPDLVDEALDARSTRPESSAPAVAESATQASPIALDLLTTPTFDPVPESAMPVLAPRDLETARRRRGEFVELPPPPDNAGSFDSLSPFSPGITDLSAVRRRDVRAELSLDARPLDRADLQAMTSPGGPVVTPSELEARDRQLQAEIASLRSELQRLTEAQQVSQQLAQLKHQQDELLRLQQSPALERLLDRVETLLMRLHEQQESVPLPPRDVAPPAPAAPAPAPAPEPGITAAEMGEGRLSLQISDDELPEILEMLSRLASSSGQQTTDKPESTGPAPLAARLEPVRSQDFVPPGVSRPVGPSALPQSASPDHVSSLTQAISQPHAVSPYQPVTGQTWAGPTSAAQCARCHQGR
jgi:TolA-binding protein